MNGTGRDPLTGIFLTEVHSGPKGCRIGNRTGSMGVQPEGIVAESSLKALNHRGCLVGKKGREYAQHKAKRSNLAQ